VSAPSVAPARERRAAPRPDPKVLARRVAVARAAGRRRLRRAGVAAAVVALGVLALVVLHSPLCSVRTVTIVGARHTTRAEVLAATGLRAHPPLIDVSSARAEAALEALPWVARARVTKRWPSAVSIVLRERVAVAAAPIPGGRVALLDPSGRVLEDVARASGVVPLAGLARVPRPGGFVEAPGASLAAVAAEVPASLVGRIAYLAERRGLGVVCRIVHGPLAVLGTAADLHEKFVALATVLARVDVTGIVTIDLRVPSRAVLTP